MERRNTFAGPYLDRAAHLRQDPAWFASALADESSRVVPVWRGRSLICAPDCSAAAGGTEAAPLHAALVELAKLPAEVRNADALILLGRFAGRFCFTCEFESDEPPRLVADARFEDLRLIASRLPAEDAGLLAYARALVSWRRKHRFCGVCGSAAAPARSGHVQVCTNPACGNEQFPRLDPAIIVLVSDGERALLGRQAAWPKGRYSTIAGFVEPGESLEDAVAREVLEETGISIDAIEYHSSQPWPFPASLMLGFTAHATSGHIVRNDEELEDARWFTREELASGTVLFPAIQSISFRLIEHWYDAKGGLSLRELHGEPAPLSAPVPNVRA
jgi:NAD+ diphosphatase